MFDPYKRDDRYNVGNDKYRDGDSTNRYNNEDNLDRYRERKRERGSSRDNNFNERDKGESLRYYNTTSNSNRDHSYHKVDKYRDDERRGGERGGTRRYNNENYIKDDDDIYREDDEDLIEKEKEIEKDYSISSLPSLSKDFNKSSSSKQHQQRLEDSIPDLPENKEIREFIKSAPKTGIHMPLGKEVKFLQCWKCKAYGHRAIDKECTLFLSGSSQYESEKRFREDPMNQYKLELNEDPIITSNSGDNSRTTIDNNNNRNKNIKISRLQQLKDLLARAEETERKRLEKKKKRRENRDLEMWAERNQR